MTRITESGRKKLWHFPEQAGSQFLAPGHDQDSGFGAAILSQDHAGPQKLHGQFADTGLGGAIADSRQRFQNLRIVSADAATQRVKGKGCGKALPFQRVDVESDLEGASAPGNSFADESSGGWAGPVKAFRLIVKNVQYGFQPRNVAQHLDHDARHAFHHGTFGVAQGMPLVDTL
jgi:hypothetical protein